ncbi:MAG: glycosyltransferase family 4 protein [Sulfurimonas sp.]|nr:glycosyltransferase family 4 protein [Sulfurimonas sp.]
MNILVLASTIGSYNSLRPETEIYVSLAKHGYNITIMTNTDGGYQSRFLEHNIEVIDTYFNKKIDFKIIKKIRKTIKEKNIDIVYATNSKSISNATLACTFIDVKLITYRGTTGGLYRRDPSAYLNALSPSVDGIICVSQAVNNHVTKQTWPCNKKITTIYKGHKLEWYNQNKIDLKEFNTSEDNFNIAFVANVRPHKGLTHVLEAAKKLAHIKDIHFILIGEKISCEPYLSLINNSEMKERIHVTGFRNDAPDIISACDILVHASTRKEGLPRVILEAFASNTPVIASNIEGSMEIIDNGVNGFITPVKDYEALAKKIEKLYNELETLKTLSNNAKDTIKNKMGHDTTVKKYFEYFESLF